MNHIFTLIRAFNENNRKLTIDKKDNMVYLTVYQVMKAVALATNKDKMAGGILIEELLYYDIHVIKNVVNMQLTNISVATLKTILNKIKDIPKEDREDYYMMLVQNRKEKKDEG